MNQFHPFSKLPKELRYRIWEYTLPQDNGVLHTYGDSWLMHYSVPGMPPPSIKVPTPVALFVCYESRAVAHRWIKENKATKQFHDPEGDNDAPGMTLVRELDRDRDALYVTHDTWHDFIDNIVRDYNETDDGPLCNDIRYLAIPAFTAYYSIQNLAFVMGCTKKLKAIYVVWDDLPRDPYSLPDEESQTGVDVQPRVEIVSSPYPGETVSLKQVSTDTAREFVETGELGEWMDEMDEVWATTEVDEDMVTDEGEVRIPRINVRVAEIPRRPW
ncbi:hypothetical protein ACHAPT_006804 [Fusarium lateritium]